MTSTSSPEYWRDQTDPSILTNLGEHYAPDNEHYQLPAVWILDEFKVFIGAFKGGEKYKVHAVFAADPGYAFDKEKTIIGFPSGEIYREYAFDNLDLYIEMEALHNRGEWQIVKEAGKGMEGLKVRQCKACGESEEKIIPAEPIPAIASVSILTAENMKVIRESGYWNWKKDRSPH